MPKNYPSLLWEISGNGLKKTSYLYGTMHVSDKIVFNLPDSFFVAIKKCDAVALELDMDKWMNELMLMKEAEEKVNTVSYLKPYAFYRNAFDVDIPKEDYLKSLLQFSPNISDRLMYRNNQVKSDYQEDNYLDVFIFQAGKKLSKQIIGLEDMKKTEELSTKAEEKDDKEDEKAKEDEYEQNKLRLKQLSGDKSFYDLFEDAYRKGDLDLLDSLNKLSSSKKYLTYMLYERNKIMANRMDSIMQKGSLFTGVGAAHLPGGNGVIELLRKMGYTVRPVLSSKSDIKTKNQVDEMRYPTKFRTEYASDSLFSVSVPGKLYEIPESGSFVYYLYNDMNNGSYYCIQRMNHYGKFMDENQEVVLSRIDSLIFENIPGKLLSKEKIRSSNGYPGIEIVNRTAKGDVQKHRIFITPHEIVSFKMSGIQEYVQKGMEADAFFSSITFYEPSQGNGRYNSKFGYSIDVPQRRTVKATGGDRNVQNEIVCASDKNTDTHYLVLAASLYDFDYIEEDTFELNMLAERFCLETNKKLVSKHYTYRNGNPVLQFTSSQKSKPSLTFTGQVIINGADYYLLCTSADSAKALPFFNSFAITSKSYKAPFAGITDTTRFFNVNTQSITNAYSSIIARQKSNKKYSYTDKESKEDQVFLPKKETVVYTSPETNEKVFVEFRKFSMYYQQESMDLFWKYRMEVVSDNHSMKISRLANAKKGNSTEVNLLVTDTNSSRGIVVKMIQRCGTLYTIKTVIDTARGMGEYAKNFFETFAPKDTCQGIDITSNKLDEYFFAKLYSADTTESKPVKAAIEYVQANMLPGNVPSLIKAINHKDFNSLSTQNKKDLISCFTSVKSNESLPFLKQLYTKYSDSVEVELGILRTLARMKTSESMKTFLELMKVDVPITSSETSIPNIFTQLLDSMEVSARLFPEIIKYTQYPEYKSSIYMLLARVNDQGLVKPKEYKKQMDMILLDANYELKKYISDKKRDKSDYWYSSSKSERIYDDLNTRQQKIYNYVSLLAPYYKSADVKKFFDKMLAVTSSDKFKAVVYAKLIGNEVQVQDSLLRQLASGYSSRAMLYRTLKEQNKLQLFDKTYMNQKDLVVSQLFASSETFKKDTMVLISVNKMDYGRKSGNVYVFKTRSKDKKVWKLCYSAVQPDDAVDITFKPQFTKTNISFESETQMQKEIDTLMRKIRIDGRRRASMGDFETDAAIENFWNY